MKPLALALLIAAALVATTAAAQTLYKLIDKNGKVTYVEKPPKDFEGQVIRLDIDPKANTATLPKGSALKSPGGAAATSEDPARAAREKLEAARKALADARDNPGEGDVARVGKKGGGARPVPTEDYQKRLERLEREVREAEEELRRAERR